MYAVPRGRYQCDPYDVEVGLIQNHDQAKRKAEDYTREHPDLRWTGYWRTVVPGEASVIQVMKKPGGRHAEGDNDAGSIWSQDEADEAAKDGVGRLTDPRWVEDGSFAVEGEASVVQVVSFPGSGVLIGPSRSTAGKRTRTRPTTAWIRRD